jgi:large subunit ribosomal protein L1
MPNPKMGTVTKDVAKAVRQAKAGSIQYKAEKKGIIQGGIGKISFEKEKLLENIRSLMIAVADSKPEALKGKYLQNVYLSTTMGPGIEVELLSVDPSSPKFMLDMEQQKL